MYNNMFGQIYLNSRRKVSALCSRQIQFWKQGPTLQDKGSNQLEVEILTKEA